MPSGHLILCRPLLLLPLVPPSIRRQNASGRLWAKAPMVGGVPWYLMLGNKSCQNLVTWNSNHFIIFHSFWESWIQEGPGWVVVCGSGVQRLQVEAVLCIGYSGLPHSMAASGQSGCLQDSLGFQASDPGEDRLAFCYLCSEVTQRYCCCGHRPWLKGVG